MRKKEYAKDGIIIIIFLLIPSLLYPVIYHVKMDGDDDNDGTSWETALQSISLAISKTSGTGEIWVAEGVYYFSVDLHNLPNVCLYGGFQGSETYLQERDFIKYSTVIDWMDNEISPGLYNEGYVDGLHFSRGFGEMPIYNTGQMINCKIYKINPSGYDEVFGVRNQGVISHCEIYDNGIYQSGNYLIHNYGIISKCKIFNNGISCIKNVEGDISNCLIYNNSGVGVILYNGSIINATIYGNQEAGLSTSWGRKITNCIVWNNKLDNLISDDPAISFCCFGNATDKNGNIRANPLFVNTSGDVSTWDFHLKDGSPCIDRGTTDSLIPFDIEGNPRPGGDGLVCMGAYESPDDYLPSPSFLRRIHISPHGDNTTGESWETAFRDFPEAYISIADDICDIWVTSGTFTIPIDFKITNRLSIYGGFEGNESSLEEREIATHPAIIDGEDKYYNITFSGIIDGMKFTRIRTFAFWENWGLIKDCEFFNTCGLRNFGEIRQSNFHHYSSIENYSLTTYCLIHDSNGIANFGMVSYCSIYNNAGGINNYEGTLSHCAIYNNNSTQYAGGIVNYGGLIQDSLIYNNSSQRNVGGVLNDHFGTIMSCTICGNKGSTASSGYGGGIYNKDGVVINCISWQNTPSDLYPSLKDIYHSCFAEATEENGNVKGNPLFFNISGDASTWDLHLQNESPCIDNGTTHTLVSFIDYDGNPRPGLDGKICMGAYESPDDFEPSSPRPPVIFFVSQNGDNTDGKSWESAFQSISQSITEAMETGDVFEVWVKEGIYTETITLVNPSRSILYGGFDGSETSPSQRYPNNQPSIIEKLYNFGILDGFEITTAYSALGGGGIYNYGSVRHCKVYGNKICSFKAGIFNEGMVTDSSIYGNIGKEAGGIYNKATIRNCKVYHNEAPYGGGIYNEKNGSIMDCVIFGNIAQQDGGGIYNNLSGNVCRCIIYNNRAYGFGGGIDCNSSSGPIKQCVIYNNIAKNGGGVGVHADIQNSIIYSNHAEDRGGGIYSGNIKNCTVIGNSCLNQGAGIFSKGTIINSIIWDNDGDDVYLYRDQISYSCFREADGSNSNINTDPLFMNPIIRDYQLQDGSPCIDAGNPDPQYNDACLPPGKGTERNDMGAYGGSNNCGIAYHFPRLLLTDLTEYGDLWGAFDYGIPPLGVPQRLGWLGFKFSPGESWYPLKGNVNGAWTEDIIQLTPYGDAWVAPVGELFYDFPSRWGWLGFRYDEKEDWNGWYPLSGDVNGDGIDDLIQVTEWGDAWMALSTGFNYSPPTRWGWLGYEFSRAVLGENGAIPLVGDVNGDNRDDLIQITRYRDAWVALSMETMFESPTRWGWLGFKYAPFDGWYPLCGDMNGDGMDDLLQITPTGDPWVSLSNGDEFTTPTRWGWLNIYYNEDQGYYPILGDVNADGMEDLIQITPEGEVIIALSKGDEFDLPESWGTPGFIFDRERNYLPMFLGY